MKEETFTTGSHNTFGGVVLESDFSMCPGSNMADRITEDMKFDKYCKACAETRDERKHLNKFVK